MFFVAVASKKQCKVVRYTERILYLAGLLMSDWGYNTIFQVVVCELRWPNGRLTRYRRVRCGHGPKLA